MRSNLTVSSVIQILSDKKEGSCHFKDIHTANKRIQTPKKSYRQLYTHNIDKNASDSWLRNQNDGKISELKIPDSRKVWFILSREKDMNSNDASPKSNSFQYTNISNSVDKTRDILPSIETAIGQLSQLKQRKTSGTTRKINVSIPSPDTYDESESHDADNDTVRIRYTHGTNEEALRMTEERFHMMTVLYHDFEMDSVDIVFDANKPEVGKSADKMQRRTTELSSGESFSSEVSDKYIETNSQNQNSESLHTKSENGINNTAKIKSIEKVVVKLPHVDYESCQSTGSRTETTDESINETVKTETGEGVTDESPRHSNMSGAVNNDEVPKEVKMCCRKKRRKEKSSKKKRDPDEQIKTISIGHIGYINPQIHREAYIRALQDARYKYFRRSYPGLSVTEPYKFSYFDVNNEGEKRNDGPRRDRDFRNYVGMRRIFGDIRLDDYYNPKRGK